MRCGPDTTGRPRAALCAAPRSLADVAWIFFRLVSIWRWLVRRQDRSEEHTSELQSLMRISYAVFCLKKKNKYTKSINILDAFLSYNSALIHDIDFHVTPTTTYI